MSYIYPNLPRNTIVRLPYPRRGDSQGQETFLAPSSGKKTATMAQSAYLHTYNDLGKKWKH